jgi:hypothetical protein
MYTVRLIRVTNKGLQHGTAKGLTAALTNFYALRVGLMTKNMTLFHITALLPSPCCRGFLFTWLDFLRIFCGALALHPSKLSVLTEQTKLFSAGSYVILRLPFLASNFSPFLLQSWSFIILSVSLASLRRFPFCLARCAYRLFFKLPLRCSLRHIQRCNVTSLWLSLAGYLCLQNKMVTFVLILLACVTYVLGKKKR